MSTNAEEIVLQIRTEFEALLTHLLTKSSEQTPTAHEIESNLWQQMLHLGRSLMALALLQHSQTVAPATLTTPQGDPLPYHADKPRSYHSVFGEIRFARRYYYQPGTGAFALDAALNLPPEATSDLLREWQDRLGMYIPYHQANALLQDLLGRPFSSRILQEALIADAQQVPDFYAQAEAPLPDPQATLLVVQADGKGVPMVTDPHEAPVRRSKGQKPCRKKEAIVSSVYTLAPTPRTPQSVVESRFHSCPHDETKPRPTPHNKWLWATLDGKEAALALGWPIATGVIEGACRHLVKDRCEQSGMRWTQGGAEALLRLRSVAENGDWEAFHAYRRSQRQKTRYAYWPTASENEPLTPLRLAA